MIPPDSIIEWLFDTYAWLFEEFGGMSTFEPAGLIMPTDDSFPLSSDLSGHELALAVFSNVRDLGGFGNIDFRVEQHEDPVRASDILEGNPHGIADSGGGVAGSLQISEEELVITYSENELDDIHGLVATFAHELSHVLLATAKTEQPGGPEAHELTTDLGAVYLGFGIFMTNDVFNFRTSETGWSSSRKGYLNEIDMTYALAIFVALLAIDKKSVLKFLDRNPRGFLKKALKDLRGQQNKLERLRAIR